ncbi:mitochondrial 37S ribosomal protein mS23 KNAG_0A05410 [Huiozyma naganishii CBS 8797]|uniref:37S ribosomal protein S25, mitochondrial n=1 Tax=Huiozyma naganishii (strain ATCC MYA-139 / BCRC 22969 / CBS 8797 / KCTC 17520 / NBRC 10181 / NCYC 3082 / Yp74L-3) TaxID=1071383 RepID=J7S3V2_HUIN7|nr:hypothetical protein KNAG_0A05410 [Kazachstania naganishii CBS 8797]CCK68206.1 hypothetical protein KNAG_0A05410 [Kazachstania naganishii CBS 8797]
MKIQTNAVNILERTSAFLESGVIQKVPAWYNVVAANPPKKKFERKPIFVNPSTGKARVNLKSFLDSKRNAHEIYKTRYSMADKQVSHNALYRPPKLVYLEDQLRQLFYDQHPWERSRPMILIENNVTPKFDWSRIQQLGKRLDGESVVQRALFLLEGGHCDSLSTAYDKARFEFYRIRMQQELEEQISQEEAAMYGSVYTQSAIEFGLEKEGKVIETWKRRVIKETEAMLARRASPSESWNPEELEGENEETAEEKDGQEVENLFL